jgi:phage terminase large subunit
VKLTNVFTKNIEAYSNGYRYIINQGGTSSSKTYSVLQLLILIAMRKDNLLISIVAESLPHLKRGALRDFIKILEQEGIYSDDMHNRSSNSFQVGKSTIEFFSADESSKLRGARRDILFINECNNIDKRAFDELSVRTKQTTFLDFNPVSEFWVHEMIETRQEISFIKSTYKDNNYLDANIVKEIESRRYTDPYWWKVFGEGEIGVLDGVVFSNWKVVDEVPQSPKKVLGLDFGYTNDPTSIIEVTYSDGEIYLHEAVYQTQLTNQMIAKLIMQDETLKTNIVVCDSAEPKSIDELRLAGVRSIPADKGADSIRNGIDLMKQYKINITKSSVNLIKEFRNYRWKQDRDGKSLNVPIDIFNHGIDATRYAVTYLLGSQNKFIKPKIHIPK